MENIPSEAMGKCKLVLDGDDMGTDRVGKKRGKKQQVGGKSGGKGGNEREGEKNIEGSGMARAGSQPYQSE
jgi:hypothetical protein